MMPEQVWDEPDMPGDEPAPWHAGRFGGAAGVGHAEYLKLLRSAADGKVFDRIDPVYERYCEPEGRAKLRRDLEIYSFSRPIQTMAAGSTLRILDDKQFRGDLDHRRMADHADHAKPQPGQRRIQRGHSSRNRNERGMDPALAGTGRLAWIQC